MTNKPFDKSKWIYERTSDNKARFVLGETGTNPLVCIGVNPSTAEPDNLDPTLTRVKAWSERLGCDGWVMLNLYPQRATNPNGLHLKIKRRWHIYNIAYVRSVLLEYPNAKIWAAWGTLIEKRDYLVKCLDRIWETGLDREWITVGECSMADHPHHPLYLANDAEVTDFDVRKYLKKQYREAS